MECFLQLVTMMEDWPRENVMVALRDSGPLNGVYVVIVRGSVVPPCKHHQ